MLEKGLALDEKRADSLAKIAHAELLGHILAYSSDNERQALLVEEKNKLKLTNEIEMLKLELAKKQLQQQLELL
jgi:hypothetical protein